MTKSKKLKVKLALPFAGKVGDVDSPAPGTIVELDEEVARAMVEEGSAEFDDSKDAEGEEEEPKRPAAERGGARVEEARSEAPEKRRSK